MKIRVKRKITEDIVNEDNQGTTGLKIGRHMILR